ncbi:PLP-dependent aminotransferase family protein [Gordonia sp. CPCC 205515]|uniref:MocR-like pyridoxine biosynthesis transcription factor PdxR n=1 Tax=Gordonia sp. CPCC 205515 TaxID=3140791 RepID=UPI003AF36116
MIKQANSDPWAQVARRLGTDLFLDLQPDPTESARGRGARRRHTLAEALRTAIADGRLTPGTTLPPYRSLAADVGLARGTVAAVYQELIAEGWLVARQGSGTTVADIGHTPDPAPAGPRTETSPPTLRPTHDFSLGQPNSSLFPRRDWITATRRALTHAPDDVFGPGDPQGSMQLRQSLSGYLARVRGVRVDPERIVLTTSVMFALELLSRTVFGGTLAVESHGLGFHRDVIERGGTATTPIPIDGGGADIDTLPDHVDGVLLTPSHQYPTGVPLLPARRWAVVEWARTTGSLIVEDDYDGELRYDREPVGALQSLGPDAVIYAGSVSKTLSPAVRIAWLVLPPQLVGTVVAAKGIREPNASVLDQLVLADMIDSGAYDRHIRRSRQYYRRRRDLLAGRLAEVGIEVPGVAAGLHALIPVDPEVETQILIEAGRRGFSIAGLSWFRHPDARDAPRGGIVVGFGTPRASAFSADVDALVELFADYLPKRRLRAP